ncbi:MAG: DNA repair protein RecO [Candidatus Omnitrophica bacterium CG1_02_49_16]|nr:MAG: DNA repair protein RecO [Candidatus Omnitrophica bacterium CG1_02_49_16]
MSVTKTRAFALKTQDYRDTSLLATFYTRDYGKIRGIVKGIREAPVRFSSTVEPFSLNEILFYKRKKGGDLHLITQIDLEDLFTEVRGDLERLSYASYFIDLLNELVETEESNPAIFDLLHDALLFLSTKASCKRTARIFEVKLFESLGLMPEIKACVMCQAAHPTPAYFNVSLGGIACKNCSESGGLPVSKGTLNFLEHVRRSPFNELRPVKVSCEVGEELEKILRRFVDFHLSNKLRSVTFMEKMELV